jgi:hypothetical protein
MAAPLQDFGRVLRTLLRFARTISYGLIGFMVVFLAVRVAEITRWFAGFHPAAGVAFLVAFFVALWWFIGRPVLRFWRVPVALKPPQLPPMEERTGRDLARHLLFVERYLGALLVNPSWEGPPAEVEAAVARCRALREETGEADGAAVQALSGRVRRLEKETVQRLLAPLDRKARQVIRQEALAVGVATAVSWNGTLDAFLVLWRNCNLVARVAAIYYGRPGVRGTLAILRDVAGATLAGAYLQDLSTAAGGSLGSLFGKTAGVLGGPLLDGGLNAVATLRIGYVGKARCRAFSAWNERTRVEALGAAFKEAATFSREVVGEVIRAVGGGLWRIPATVLGKLGEAIGNFFRRSGPDEPAPAPTGP